MKEMKTSVDPGMYCRDRLVFDSSKGKPVEKYGREVDIRIFVWVKFLAQGPICLFDVLIRSRLVYPQQIVKVLGA